MFRAFFASVCLVLSIVAVVTAADIDHVKELSVTVSGVRIPLILNSPAAVLNGPVVIASQASAVSANLRKKKEEIEVDVEDVTPFAVGGPYQVQLTMNVDDEVRGNLGVATIGPSVEYPNGWNGYFSVDLKLRKMTITYSFGSVGYGGSSPDDFFGIVATSLTSGAYLPQPAYFISYSTYSSPGILTSTATTISLNWAGLNFMQGDTIVIGW